MRAIVRFGVSILALALPLAGAGAGASVDVVAKISVGKKPCAAAAGFGAVWVTNYGQGTVRVKVAASIRVGSSPFDVLYAAGSVWSSDNADGEISRIDPRTNRSSGGSRSPKAPPASHSRPARS